MTAPSVLENAPGLGEYADAVERRLDETIAHYGGLVARAGAEAIAGGKRLRPLLVYLAAPPGRPPTVAAGVAVELVHVATLVHDDLIDRAELRHGRPSVWSAHGVRAAIATGDYLFARAFAELSTTGSAGDIATLARTAVAISRGEALQRRQVHDPDVTVEAYLERCTLKTAKLFEAACLLASHDDRLGRFGLALGIAFQIADDVLDCTGDTVDTGKIPGTDLREGTPTLPLLLAAREDEAVRIALAGGSRDGALARVAATGALEQSRTVALEYARRAREELAGVPYGDALEPLTHVVVDRTR